MCIEVKLQSNEENHEHQKYFLNVMQEKKPIAHEKPNSKQGG